MLATKVPILVLIALIAGVTVRGQTDPPNRAGVTLSQLPYVVEDVPANREFWVTLGGTPAEGRGAAEVIVFPGVSIVLTRGQTSGSEGAVIAHAAFRVTTFAQVEAKGLTGERWPIEGRESGMVISPNGDRVELFEENADQGRFRAEPAHADGSNRHDEPMTAPIVPDHLHLNVPARQDARAQQWYVDVFGAVPGIRLRYPAADVPGMNFTFSAVQAATAPTSGRSLDHVGFEVRSLEAFAPRLAEVGAVVERGTDAWSGRAVLRFVDPWGTSLEVAEAR